MYRAGDPGRSVIPVAPMKWFAIAPVKKPTRLAPILVPLVMVAVTTGVLLTLDIFLDTERLVFGYLVPTTLAAVAYGSLIGTFTAIASALCAAYFFYPPIFTIWVEKPLHAVELFIFAALALAASHIVGGLSDRRRD
jgi:two-component system sensor histidine kinase KdpD